MTFKRLLAPALAFICASAATLPALAHPGHGAATEIHWHASDTYGFIVVAVLAGLALWSSRGE